MTLDLPNGETIQPGTVILFEGYPYRYVEDDHGVMLSPLYWGESDLDLWFESERELHDRWGSDSHGTLSEQEWRTWLRDARESPMFSEGELDSIAREVLPQESLVDRLKRFLTR